MHKTLHILLLLLVALPMRAQLTADEALSRAQQFLNQQSQQTEGQTVRRAKALQQAQLVYSSDALYAFENGGEGFMLCPALPSLPPIVGYNDRGTFAAAQRSSVFQLLLKSMEQAVQNGTNTTGYIFRPDGVADAVGPLCTDMWAQMHPYNLYCPVVDGDTCVTGCVATAMATVMHRWQWPAKGTGSYTYTDSIGCKQTLTADFGSHTYDWANMIDDYYAVDYTPLQAQAVALLMSDCGISVDMRYGTSTSGAHCIRQPMALVNYFGYDEDVQQLFRNFYSQQEWDSIMFCELDAGRPLILGGYSNTLAHSFVCDGYDANGLFHIRFGNDDRDANGYYYFTWLTPQQPAWYDLDSPENGMNLLQTILVGLHPKTGAASAQRYSYAFSHIKALSNSQIVVNSLANVGWNLHSGRVGIALKPLSAGKAPTNADATALLYTYSRQFPLEEVEDTCFTDTLTISIPAGTAAGNYRVVPVFEQSGTFVEARTMVGQPNYLSCTIDGSGNATLAFPEAETPQLVVSDVVASDSVVAYSDTLRLSFRIANQGAEYSGRLYFSLVPNSETPLTTNVYTGQGLSITNGESLQREFTHTRVRGIAAGDYHLRIMADIDLFTDSLQLLYEGTETITVLPYGWGTSISAPTLSDADADACDDRYFDLTGRMVPKEQLRRGIYIHQRRKIFVP